MAQGRPALLRVVGAQRVWIQQYRKLVLAAVVVWSYRWQWFDLSLSPCPGDDRFFPPALGTRGPQFTFNDRSPTPKRACAMAFWVLRQVRRIRCCTLPSPSGNMLIRMEGSWILRSATLAYASVKQLIHSKNWDARFFAKGLHLPSFEVLDLKAQTRSVERTLLRQRLKCTTGFLKPAKDFQNKASRHRQILFSQNSGKFREFPGEIHLKRGVFPSVAPITTRQRNLANAWNSQTAALAAVPTSVLDDSFAPSLWAASAR